MSEKPTPPEDWECCESNCTPCVWDTYYEELREWNASQKNATQKAEASQQKTDANDKE